MLRAGMTALATLALAAMMATAAVADERIHRYHAEIAVPAAGPITVTETIEVSAEGERIRRGIYRDLPTDYEDEAGNRIRIVPEFRSVRRNGSAEPHHTERRSNGIRLYIGSADELVPRGRHVYEITYTVDRVLGYFDDHDELYWNVTGNQWAFPIDEAAATVRLPDSVDAADVGVEAYTGPFGATGQDYEASVDFRGNAVFRGTRELRPEEGLTIVVSWPKGHVAEPTAADDLRFLLSQNLGLLIALSGAAGSLFYLLTAWRRTGVDPEPGVIFPHYEPPEGYSPASLRYVAEMGYDKRTFTAAVLNLAVKGFVTIEEDDGDYALDRTAKTDDGSLAPGESAILSHLFASANRMALDNQYHSIVGGAMKAHEKALKRDYYQRYFVSNSGLLLPAVVLLLGAGIGAAIADRLTLFAAIALAAGGAGVVLFAWLLKAPTPHGRRLLDKVEGFRLYLEVAEKDELNLRNPPERTPELFEAYLPFALALEVEQPWAEQFADVFARLRGETGSDWHPRWYAGRWDAGNPVKMSRAVGSSLNSAIASAATPPGSSSGGGGGGSSGGGGGGGGGGGW
ncbi:DUF2207 domain-containing protein [Lentisalinibacter orientalis]|uniref:DUF2207 domain-containing protein n=1 Tax=Lentisalinibacter orientalis TaxID=2992241 RepID=UPI003862F0EF